MAAKKTVKVPAPRDPLAGAGAKYPPVPLGTVPYRFDVSGIDAIRVELFEKMKDKKKPARVGITQDGDMINDLVELLGQIPRTGNEMRKMGPSAELMLATFYDGSAAVSQIAFYRGELKLPDTSFSGESNPDQKKLYQALRALLQK